MDRATISALTVNNLRLVALTTEPSVGGDELSQLAPAVYPDIKGAGILIALQLQAQMTRARDELQRGTISLVEPRWAAEVQGGEQALGNARLLQTTAIALNPDRTIIGKQHQGIARMRAGAQSRIHRGPQIHEQQILV